MTREGFLDSAKAIVLHDREDQYGPPEDSFRAIANLWTAYTGRPFTPEDVGIMMALMKVARIKTGVYKDDSFIDAIGYMACAAQIASEEADREARIREREF